jgi:hypothetical protein
MKPNSPLQQDCTKKLGKAEAAYKTQAAEAYAGGGFANSCEGCEYYKSTCRLTCKKCKHPTRNRMGLTTVIITTCSSFLVDNKLGRLSCHT